MTNNRVKEDLLAGQQYRIKEKRYSYLGFACLGVMADNIQYIV